MCCVLVVSKPCPGFNVAGVMFWYFGRGLMFWYFGRGYVLVFWQGPYVVVLLVLEAIAS